MLRPTIQGFLFLKATAESGLFDTGKALAATYLTNLTVEESIILNHYTYAAHVQFRKSFFNFSIMLPTSQYTRIIGCTEFSKIDLKYFLYAEFLMAKAHLQSLNLNPRLNEYLNKLSPLASANIKFAKSQPL
mgnify:CR=1 FL=1